MCASRALAGFINGLPTLGRMPPTKHTSNIEGKWEVILLRCFCQDREWRKCGRLRRFRLFFGSIEITSTTKYDVSRRVLPAFFISVTQRRIYQNDYPYFITTNTTFRQPWFENGMLAERLAGCIVFGCRIKGFILLAYCMLPDHVHMLVMKQPLQRTLSSVRCMDKNPSTPQRGLSSPCCTQNTISDLVQSIKGTFSRASRLFPSFDEVEKIWQPRFTPDQVRGRIVNTQRRLRNTLQYIRFNHQKHDLPEQPHGQPPYVFLDERATAEM